MWIEETCQKAGRVPACLEKAVAGPQGLSLAAYLLPLIVVEELR